MFSPTKTCVLDKETDKQLDQFVLFNIFFIDTVEIFIISLIYKILSNDNKLSILVLLRNSLLLGGVLLLISIYNENLKKTIKQGVTISMGATMYRALTS